MDWSPIDIVIVHSSVADNADADGLSINTPDHENGRTSIFAVEEVINFFFNEKLWLDVVVLVFKLVRIVHLAKRPQFLFHPMD